MAPPDPPSDAPVPPADEPVPPGDAEVVPLSGEIDVANADAIGDRLCEAVDAAPQGPRIIVDCEDVPFVDSRGLAMMLRVQRHADTAGRALTWSRLREHPRSLLRITALDATIKLED